jgi:hypothetical protein
MESAAQRSRGTTYQRGKREGPSRTGTGRPVMNTLRGRRLSVSGKTWGRRMATGPEARTALSHPGIGFSTLDLAYHILPGFTIRDLTPCLRHTVCTHGNGTSPPAFGIPLSTRWRGGRATARGNGKRQRPKATTRGNGKRQRPKATTRGKGPGQRQKAKAGPSGCLWRRRRGGTGPAAEGLSAFAGAAFVL